MLYPRKILITRAHKNPKAGALPYGGRTQAETDYVVMKDVRASIQARREGQRNPAGLPADGTKATWRIFTPRGAIEEGFVMDGDVITDDLGRRFQVTSDYCHNLGCTFFAERLES